MKYHTLFLSKLGKMSQNLSSAAVVIGALRVNKGTDQTGWMCRLVYDLVVHMQ